MNKLDKLIEHLENLGNKITEPKIKSLGICNAMDDIIPNNMSNIINRIGCLKNWEHYGNFGWWIADPNKELSPQNIYDKYNKKYKNQWIHGDPYCELRFKACLILAEHIKQNYDRYAEELKLQDYKMKLYKLTDVMPFGKHKGKQIEDLIYDELGYVTWLFEEDEIEFDVEVIKILEERS